VKTDLRLQNSLADKFSEAISSRPFMLAAGFVVNKHGDCGSFSYSGWYIAEFLMVLNYSFFETVS